MGCFLPGFSWCAEVDDVAALDAEDVVVGVSLALEALEVGEEDLEPERCDDGSATGSWERETGSCGDGSVDFDAMY